MIFCFCKRIFMSIKIEYQQILKIHTHTYHVNVWKSLRRVSLNSRHFHAMDVHIAIANSSESPHSHAQPLARITDGFGKEHGFTHGQVIQLLLCSDAWQNIAIVTWMGASRGKAKVRVSQSMSTSGSLPNWLDSIWTIAWLNITMYQRGGVVW